MLATHRALGATFHFARSLIAITGMVADFISAIVSRGSAPPNIPIGTIVVTSVAAIYCIITALLLDDIIPFLTCACLDGLFMIALVVVSVIIGKPLSYLSCYGLSGGSQSSVLAFTTRLVNMIAHHFGQKVRHEDWVGVSKAVCLETEAIWEFGIGLCILFLLTGVTATCLSRQKRITGTEKLDG